MYLRHWIFFFFWILFILRILILVYPLSMLTIWGSPRKILWVTKFSETPFLLSRFYSFTAPLFTQTFEKFHPLFFFSFFPTSHSVFRKWKFPMSLLSALNAGFNECVYIYIYIDTQIYIFTPLEAHSLLKVIINLSSSLRPGLKRGTIDYEMDFFGHKRDNGREKQIRNTSRGMVFSATTQDPVP